MLAPKTREQIAETVRIAAPYDGVRPVGSCTSKSPCFETGGVCVSLTHFNHIEKLEDSQVRVGAGVLLADLIAFLREHGLSLPTIGEWTGQTMGGAISTGTHGGSYRCGSLCSSVLRLTLIDGAGDWREYRRGDPGFDHILPSFGTTGIIVEFDLQCEPVFQLSMDRRLYPFNDYVDEFLKNPQSFEFRAAIWIPALGNVIDYAATRTDDVAKGTGSRREVRFNTRAMALDWASRNAPEPTLPLLSLAARALFPVRNYVAPYDILLAPLHGSAQAILRKRARNRTPPEGEFAVAVQQAPALLAELDSLFRRRGAFPDRPVGLRPGPRETGTLAATGATDCVYVSMFIDSHSELLQELNDVLLRFECRPHWGKCVFQPPEMVAALYPRWSEFCEFRNMLDPSRRFINDFALKLGM